MTPTWPRAGPMRIGTWNLQGRWDPRHLELLSTHDCDVWLLTEVNDRVELPGYDEVRTDALMAPRRRWAGVFAREPVQPEMGTHTATAAATVGGVTCWSSVLPWRSSGGAPTWRGDRHADRTASTVAAMLAVDVDPDRLVWGGDWNHALAGREYTGSVAGRTSVLAALEALELQVPTHELPHRLDGLLSIDHIAVPASWRVEDAYRVVASDAERRLSDHDAYVVSATPRWTNVTSRVG
jgi:hypothetical protein